jgi:hypothetical protein
MSAEVYHLSIEGGELYGVCGRIIPDGQTFCIDNYTNDEGTETFVKVEESGVHAYTGRSIERIDTEGRHSRRANLFEHRGTVEPGGRPLTEELTGPEGERVVMGVRDIGANAVNPYVVEIPTDPPIEVAVN